jgi:hypothetical protein
MASTGVSVYSPTGCFVIINKMKGLISMLTRLMVVRKNWLPPFRAFEQVLNYKLLLGIGQNFGFWPLRVFCFVLFNVS